MAGKKFYAVASGKETGIFTSWQVVKPLVTGYKGARYKGFATKEKAEAWLYGKEETEDTPLVTAWVDGSFDAARGVYGYGLLLFDASGKKVYTEKGADNNPSYARHRNVAGEVLGAMAAVGAASRLGFSSLRLCYDYEGIRAWAVGDWRANLPLTKAYQAFMQASDVAVSFKKIAAHTGVAENEAADHLAKEAVKAFRE